jgi:hypothetical protein
MADSKHTTTASISPRLWAADSTGFNRSAIMKRALASARESRAWQIKFAASPNGIRTGSKPQSWRFLMSRALKAAWTFARAERHIHSAQNYNPAFKATLASLSTDGRLAA